MYQSNVLELLGTHNYVHCKWVSKIETEYCFLKIFRGPPDSPIEFGCTNVPLCGSTTSLRAIIIHKNNHIQKSIVSKLLDYESL